MCLWKNMLQRLADFASPDSPRILLISPLKQLSMKQEKSNGENRDSQCFIPVMFYSCHDSPCQNLCSFLTLSKAQCSNTLTAKMLFGSLLLLSQNGLASSVHSHQSVQELKFYRKSTVRPSPYERNTRGIVSHQSELR